MTATPFLVPVSDLLAEPGARRDVTIDTSVDWGYEMAEVGPEIHAHLVIENASGTLVVRGRARFTLGLTCHRCLTQWYEALEIQLTEAVGFEGEDDEGDEYGLDGDTLDLEPMLRDAVLLEAPLRPLCNEGCRGLCATCGADLNTDSCPGHAEESMSPFAELRDLLEP